jgi:hypothetical protein
MWTVVSLFIYPDVSSLTKSSHAAALDRLRTSQHLEDMDVRELPETYLMGILVQQQRSARGTVDVL